MVQVSLWGDVRVASKAIEAAPRSEAPSLWESPRKAHTRRIGIDVVMQ